MKKLITLVFLFFSFLIAQAQHPKLDSIERLIRRASTDTARINRMNEKISLLGEVNLDSAVALCLRTINYARRVRYTSGEAFARMRLANNYSFKGNYAAARPNLKIAESIYTSLDDSAHLIKIYNTYGTMYGMQSKYDSSIVFFERSRIIAEKTNRLPDLAIVYMNLGISYDMLSNHAQALRYQQKALTLAETLHDLNSQAYCLVNLANAYRQMGDQERAVHPVRIVEFLRNGEAEARHQRGDVAVEIGVQGRFLAGRLALRGVGDRLPQEREERARIEGLGGARDGDVSRHGVFPVKHWGASPDSIRVSCAPRAP
jgi:tetratricopeptide (TPR) repeat protein